MLKWYERMPWLVVEKKLKLEVNGIIQNVILSWMNERYWIKFSAHEVDDSMHSELKRM